MTSAEQLCLACGLCCDGSLFDIVRLGPKDSIQTLLARGLPVRTSRARTPVVYMRQPCAALCADRRCQVYAQRPAQCRSFECAVFKQHQAGTLRREQALSWIKRAQRLSQAIRRDLAALGETDQSRSLHDRFRRLQRRLNTEGTTSEMAETVAAVNLAMHQLHLLAHARFYTRPESD